MVPSTARSGEVEAPPSAATDEARLIARYIKPHPHEPGRAYAYVAPNGPSVSAIARTMLEKGRNLPSIASRWEIEEEAVRAALAFYDKNRDVIDARILLEDDAFDPDFG